MKPRQQTPATLFIHTHACYHIGRDGDLQQAAQVTLQKIEQFKAGLDAHKPPIMMLDYWPKIEREIRSIAEGN